MTSTQVKELPLNNRNFVQLATLAPGVSSDLADEVGVGLDQHGQHLDQRRAPQRGELAGGRRRRTSTSARTSRCCRRPSLESIEEFKIITNGYQAEWPRSGGGIINVVTKSGTSRLHRQRLRVPAQRQAQRELVLPQPEARTRRSTARRRR